VKKICSAFLGILSLLVVLVLAVGCYRPAAPAATPTLAGEAEAATPGEVPDIEATAIARSTESAATMAAQTPAAEGEEAATEGPTEAAPTATPEPTTPPPPATDTPAPTSAPTATPAPPVTGATTHIVQPGENMFRIALRYGTTVDAIARANGIANPNLVYVGQELTIPGAGDQPPQPAPGAVTYVTVQPGDNLFRIALRYGMDYRYLAQYNGIPYPYNISVGQIIKIPAR
jgi:LysM repeat protein